jgi:class 3 adenylate cyclase/predicted ATPase
VAKGAHCTACDTDNPPGAKFCLECGAAFSRRCPGCGQALPPAAKFCLECGAKLGNPPPSSVRITAEPPRQTPGNDVERRLLSVMFCDLVGSARLASDLDPEDMRELLVSYQQCAHQVVTAFDGFVAQHLGDGLLVYFGYPNAHEDDARRAVLSALGIVEAIDHLNERLRTRYGVDLAVRIGVDTGHVVVGGMGSAERREQLAVGEAPNVAARLQAEALPAQVLISASTHRVVERTVECVSLGVRSLRNVTEPVEVFRVVRPLVRRPTASAPGAQIIGRETEVQLLLGCWRDVHQRRGRVVVVTGEPGIGKSRLVSQLRASLSEQPHLFVHTAGSPYHTDSALQPILDAAPSLFGLDAADRPEDQLAKLSANLQSLGLDAPARWLVGSFLGLPVEPDAAASALSPQVRRQRTLAAIEATLFAHAEKTPVVLCVEDLHWVDQTTLDLLESVSKHGSDAALLILLTTRLDYRVPWQVGCEITLRGLPPDRARALVVERVSSRIVSPALIEAIVSRSDGNPLFLEELATMVVEQKGAGADEGAELPIPTTLEASLVARLDRLGPARTVAQVGATIGRRFTFELVQDVLGLGEDELEAVLHRLTASELVTQQGVPPRAAYVFRHALIRDAAYGSLTRRTRSQYHQRVADVLRLKCPETLPGVLAQHDEEAGELARAATEYLRAGRLSLGGFALAETLGHLRRGLGCVEQLPASPERFDLELATKVLMGVPLMLTRGFAAPEVERHYESVRTLCENSGDAATDQLFPALYGLWSFYQVSGHPARAQVMGERLRDLAARTGNDAIELAASIGYGTARLMQGDLAAARAAYERGLAVYDAARHAPLSMLFGQDGGAMCASFLTWVHAHEGDIEAGRRRAAEAIAICDALQHPGTRGFVDAVLATFHCLTEEPELARTRANSVIELAAQEGMPHWAAQGAINLGWALTGLGDAERASPLIRENIAALLGIGTRAAMGYFQGALVASELARGDLDAAESALRDGLAFVHEVGERLHEPELLRLGAEIALRRGDQKAAREALHRAADLAGTQGAKRFESRARQLLAQLQ